MTEHYAQLSRYLTGEVRTHFESRTAYTDPLEDTPSKLAGVANLDDWLKRLLNE